MTFDSFANFSVAVILIAAAVVLIWAGLVYPDVNSGMAIGVSAAGLMLAGLFFAGKGVEKLHHN
ncbi:MAG: hypothetical protein UY35_C0035G0003 [Candidatus Saccharibacteria bacterium GW2011_GWC2_48_9]|nr:MAG: hypothetical protein UY35_C0035G0003 [Candidatus Saccharibacteria bacterium GW2011_GWC2_48_9]HCH34652.1 hypothetical protein [Candidatus Saccharibacteria bacterium]